MVFRVSYGFVCAWLCRCMMCVLAMRLVKEFSLPEITVIQFDDFVEVNFDE